MFLVVEAEFGEEGGGSGWDGVGGSDGAGPRQGRRCVQLEGARLQVVGQLLGVDRPALPPAALQLAHPIYNYSHHLPPMGTRDNQGLPAGFRGRPAAQR